MVREGTTRNLGWEREDGDTDPLIDLAELSDYEAGSEEEEPASENE